MGLKPPPAILLFIQIESQRDADTPRDCAPLDPATLRVLGLRPLCGVPHRTMETASDLTINPAHRKRVGRG